MADVRKEQERICERLMQLVLPIFGIGLNEYMIKGCDEYVDRVRVVDAKLFFEEYGVKKDFKLKYYIFIPKSYYQMPPKEFIESITKDLLDVAERLNLNTSKIVSFLEKCNEI